MPDAVAHPFLALREITKLHLEFKDEKGKHRSYDFVSQDAGHSNNEWYEGPDRAAFYVKHGMNSGIPSRRKISRSAVKEYVKRIRKAFGLSFRDIGLDLDPKRVLVSKTTVGNEIHYQLRARIEWVHLGSDCVRAIDPTVAR